jgi:hypothetical protein
MSKTETKDLLKFLKPFPVETRQTVLRLRDFVWDLYPQANELIYDNYNALALGWSPTEKAGHSFCGIAVWRSNSSIHFGFYWGSAISDPEKRFRGQGHQYRYIPVQNIETFPATYIRKLMAEAYGHSLSKVKDKRQIVSGLTITKSISAKKRTDMKSAKKPAKTCYSHLGGKLGTLLMEAFIDKGWIAKQDPKDKHFYITDKGEKGLARLGLDMTQIRSEES